MAVAFGLSFVAHCCVLFYPWEGDASEGKRAASAGVALAATLEREIVKEETPDHAVSRDSSPKSVAIDEVPGHQSGRTLSAEFPSELPEGPQNEVGEVGVFVMPQPEVRYLKGSELTERPRPLEPVDVKYPESVALQDVDREGGVVLRLLIDETGEVDQALVESSDLPSIFGETAASSFSQIRFSPGRVAAAAVKSQMLVEVSFGR
jgi:hypothetical protein